MAYRSLKSLVSRQRLLAPSLVALLQIASLGACQRLGSDNTDSQTQAVVLANETDFYTDLGPVTLQAAEAENFLDVRGVGDSGWTNTHEHTPLAAGFGRALDKFDASGQSYRGDLSFINWESVVGNGCDRFWAPYNPGTSYAFVSRPENLAQAYSRGFNLISLSNNHTRDCFNNSSGGQDGIRMTVAAMRELDSGRSWLWHGVDTTESQKNIAKIRTFNVKGRTVRVAFASLYTGRSQCPLSVCNADAEAVLASLRDANVDFRILSLHSQNSQPEVVRIGSRFITAFNGDVVFGHGPHVWQPVRVLRKPNGKRGVMFESLGNFLHPSLGSQARNAVGRALFDLGTLSLRQVQVIPVVNAGNVSHFSGASASEIGGNVSWTRSQSVRGAYANIKQAAIKLAAIECPDGFTSENVGDEGGKICSDGTNAIGPFTQTMITRCVAWGGGDEACHSDRWALNLVVSARGKGVCPDGAFLDTTGYCAEGNNAFGPFPAALIIKCIARDGGHQACHSARWSLSFLTSLLAD